MKSASLIKLKTTKPIDAHWLCPGSSCWVVGFRLGTSATEVNRPHRHPLRLVSKSNPPWWVMQKAKGVGRIRFFSWDIYTDSAISPVDLSPWALSIHPTVTADLNFPRASAIQPTLCPSHLEGESGIPTDFAVCCARKQTWGPSMSQMGGYQGTNQNRDHWKSDGENDLD